MWVIPKNLKMSSAFAPDTVDSKEDLHLLESTIESSLAWKSKHTSLQTWCKKWNRIKWLPHLFGRMLKPFQEKDFEKKWTSLLEDTHVNHSLLPVINLEQKTQDTSGLSSCSKFKQLDLFNVSSKTSKDTLTEGLSKSSLTWSQQVTIQRGEYSQRQKLAHLTKEKECLSWATPNTMDHLDQKSPETIYRQATTVRKGRKRPSNLREQVNPVAVKIYQIANLPTPAARDYKGAVKPETLAKKNRNPLTNSLPDAVRHLSGSGYLNPDWIEWLMGVPTGLTELDSWETE